MHSYLEFEKSVADLEGKIKELRTLQSNEDGVGISDEITTLQEKARQALADIYAKLTPWQKALVARHPDRPHALNYIEALIDDFTPLAGDRYFAEDAAIVAGLGRFNGRSVAVIGTEKGSDMQSRLKHNFGSARPEGYRKAVRVMEMAGRFNIPVISLVDTAGAYPGIGAEERGQAEAIAQSTKSCLSLPVPNISIIIGEGGSGGAIALASANKVLMLEHAIYSVISPEGAASILWRDSTRAQDAALAMKITAKDLLDLNVIDQILTEPVGGAHRDKSTMIKRVGEAIEAALTPLLDLSADDIRRSRQQKFMAIGRVG